MAVRSATINVMGGAALKAARGLIREDSSGLFGEPLRRKFGLHQFRYNLPFRHQVHHTEERRLDKSLPQEPA